MKKRFLSVLMAAGLSLGLLAGCGSSEEPVAGSAEDELSAEDVDDEDIVEIELYAMTLYGTDGVEEVEEAINDISEEEIGVHVNLNLLDMASYSEQTSLMFSSQEQMDLMMLTPIPAAGFSTLTSQNQLMALNDLLPEYAPELYEMMEEYLGATTVGDSVYAVSDNRDLTANAYIWMRADVLEDLGLTEKAENCGSWTEIQEILQALVDSNFDGGKVQAGLANNNSDGDVITLENSMIGSDDWSETYAFDSLGDTYRIVAVDEETDTVFDYYESEDYYDMICLMNEMYEKGYVYKDAATSDEDASTLMRNDVTFAGLSFSQSNIATSEYNSTGYEVVACEITQGDIYTNSAIQWAWAIPVTAKEPEASAEFMNLMYTNEEVANLLVWGIEGRDYEVNEEGEAVILDTVEYQSSDWLWGNQFLAYPALNEGGDYREIAQEKMDNTDLSKYFGCTVDTTGITNEITAVNHVIMQYTPGYSSGSVAVPDTYEEYYNGEFCEALRAAGVQTIIDEYQSQLDAWMAE